MINVMTSLLEVSGLTVELSTVDGWVRPVKPVSALNVSVGAQVLLLLQDLQREFALTYIFISHSLPVVAQVATHIAVMRAGQFVETGPVGFSSNPSTTTPANCFPPSRSCRERDFS